MSKPFFSIVIPTYNRAHSIGLTLASCFEQTFEDFEIIVVDDGSTDSTALYMKTVTDHRLRYVQKGNGGPAAARNLGVAEARGRYVAFLDSDDRFLPRKLEIFAQQIEATQCDVLYGQILVDRGVEKYWVRPASAICEGESMFDYLFLRRGVLLPSTLVVERTLALRCPFDESLWFGDNDQFAIDLFLAGASISMVSPPLSYYDDQYCADRLSQSPVFDHTSSQHQAFFDWVERRRALMSDRAYQAYKARFRSRLIVRDAPMEALADIVSAYRCGALSGKDSIRQGLQTFMPHTYRRAADWVARTRGQS